MILHTIDIFSSSTQRRSSNCTSASRFFVEERPKDAAKPDDHPCRSRPTQWVGVRVRVGFGLGPTCKIHQNMLHKLTSKVRWCCNQRHPEQTSKRSVEHKPVHRYVWSPGTGSMCFWLPLRVCAGLVGAELSAGPVLSIATLHVGPDQPDSRPHPNPNPNPLGASRSAGAVTRLRRVFGWRFSEKIYRGSRKASLDQYDLHPE